MDWKRYPYVPEWGDPGRFTFPDVDGYQSNLGVATYFLDGFLRGRSSGRQFAFMVIVTDTKFRRRLRAAFYTFALFDCDRRHYGTYTDFDFPRPPRIRRGYKIDAREKHLDLRYHASAGDAVWRHARNGDGALRPFAWEVQLVGTDHHGARMALSLDVDATRPPGPLGGRQLGGEMFFLGAPSTYSYFQSGLRMRGRLEWGEHAEDVEGDVGWIDRQWAENDFSAYQDLPHSSRYRNEWRVMQFDDGWDMSLFHQYHRHAHSAVVPWSGMSAQGPGPAFELRASHRVELVIPEFIRSPGVVRGTRMLTEGPRWFPHRYRVRIPAWDMDVRAEPLVDAPAHHLPIEYWTGPVRISGTLWGRSVTGLGFDERSRPWCRAFEIAAALRLTVENLDDLDEDARWLLAYRAWEVEAIALRNDPAGAAAYFRRRVAPLVGGLPAAVRPRVEPIATDLLQVLERGGRVL